MGKKGILIEDAAKEIMDNSLRMIADFYRAGDKEKFLQYAPQVFEMYAEDEKSEDALEVLSGAIYALKDIHKSGNKEKYLQYAPQVWRMCDSFTNLAQWLDVDE